MVDQAAETIATLDRPSGDPCWRVGKFQPESVVGTLLVVVHEVGGRDACEVVFAADQDPVEAFVTDRADEPLRVRVCDRRAQE